MSVSSQSWRLRFSPAVAVCMVTGLTVCQVLAAIQMVHVNSWLVARSLDAAAGSALFVPGPSALRDALSPIAIFNGALFLTISIGSGISLLTILAVAAAKSECRLLKTGFWIVCASGLYLLVQVNRNGPNLFGSACLVLIPLSICLVAYRLQLSFRFPAMTPARLFQLSVLLLLIAAWISVAGRESFTRLRDRLQQSTGCGVSITQFYYRYAFSAAASLKSYRQRRMHTWFIEPGTDPRVVEDLANRHAILTQALVSERAHADLILQTRGSDLILKTPRRTVLTVPLDDYLSNPTAVRWRFSALSDRQQALRGFAYLSLLIVLPLLGGLLLHAFGFRIAAVVLSRRRADFSASFLVLFCGLALLYLLQSSHHRISARSRLAGAAINAVSLNDATELQHLVSDQPPAIVCQSIRLLGDEKPDSARPILRSVIRTSESWYLQDCALQSLLQLGDASPQRMP